LPSIHHDVDLPAAAAAGSLFNDAMRVAADLGAQLDRHEPIEIEHERTHSKYIIDSATDGMFHHAPPPGRWWLVVAGPRTFDVVDRNSGDTIKSRDSMKLLSHFHHAYQQKEESNHRSLMSPCYRTALYALDPSSMVYAYHHQQQLIIVMPLPDGEPPRAAVPPSLGGNLRERQTRLVL
jgi:hypothetical protein